MYPVTKSIKKWVGAGGGEEVNGCPCLVKETVLQIILLMKQEKFNFTVNSLVTGNLNQIFNGLYIIVQWVWILIEDSWIDQKKMTESDFLKWPNSCPRGA